MRRGPGPRLRFNSGIRDPGLRKNTWTFPPPLKIWRSTEAFGEGGEVRLKQIMIRKLKSGEYRLYSRKTDPKTGRRRNLGTFSSRAAAEKHERAVQFFKKH
jgi:hypothetical protein